MHLSKIKHMKFNESAQLLVFYVVASVFGINIIYTVSLMCAKVVRPYLNLQIFNHMTVFYLFDFRKNIWRIRRVWRTIILTPT